MELEKLIAGIKGKRLTYISIKLPNEAGEIVVFEVLRQQIAGKFGRIPNNKTVALVTPRYN